MISLHFIIVLLMISPNKAGYENNNILKAVENLHIESAKKILISMNGSTLLEIYEAAIKSYLTEDWDACILGFQNFMYKYKEYKNVVVNCRKKCRTELKKFTPMFIDNIEDLHFYEKIIKETLCILKCNQEYRERAGGNALKRLPQKQELKIMFAEHYKYLHICYSQKYDYQKAANSVFTYLIYHPDHQPSKSSLAYYMSHIQNKTHMIQNLLMESFIYDYIKAVKFYEREYYEKAVTHFESSLKSYIESEESCRFYCEGPLKHHWNLEFITAFSNHFVTNLYCKRSCARDLRTLNGEYRPDFLADHFNYLQFAYYKLHKIKKVCEAVESYLLFYPTDETMLQNKQFYTALFTIEQNYFKPRREILIYVIRQEYEMRLLLYISEEFTAFENTL